MEAGEQPEVRRFRELLAEGMSGWLGSPAELDAAIEFERSWERLVQQGAVAEAWRSLHGLRGPSPSEELYELVQTLEHEHLVELLQALNDCGSPIQITWLAPQLRGATSRRILSTWLTNPGFTETLVGLGFLRGLEWCTSRDTGPDSAGIEARTAENEKVSERLRLVGDWLEATYPNLAGRLWWQGWGQLPRFCPRTEPAASIFYSAFSNEAALRISSAAEADLIPDQQQRDHWFALNPDWMALLPFIHERGGSPNAATVAQRILEDETRRLDGELHDLPSLDKPTGEDMIRAVTWAYLQELPDLHTTWRSNIDQVLERMSPWPLGQLRTGDSDRLARCLLVSSAVARSLRNSDEDGWEVIAVEVLHIAVGVLGRFGFQEHSHSGALRNLPLNLIHLALILPGELACEWTMQVASHIRNAATLSSAIKLMNESAPNLATQELLESLEERRAFEAFLESGSETN